jgi:two-component system response regulator HupR/HoxA
MASKCLLVEDDPGYRKSVARLLKQYCDLEITEAPDAIRALRILHQNPNQFDILVTDEVMPVGPTGMVLLEIAKERWPVMRRVLLSGFTNSEQVHSGIADAVLDKIFDRRLIATKICRLAKSR